MPSSSDTAFTPESSPRRKDFAKPTSHQGKYGHGPGLQDPDDPIQKSDEAYDQHLDKAGEAVGAGPTTRPPAAYHQMEPHSHLLNMPTAQTNGSRRSHKTTASEVQRDSTISKLRTKIGLQPEAPIMEGHEVHHNLAWSAFRTTLREPLAEFFGTFVMVLFGNGSVAQVQLSAGEITAPGKNGFGNYQSINWGYVLLPSSQSDA